VIESETLVIEPPHRLANAPTEAAHRLAATHLGGFGGAGLTTEFLPKRMQCGSNRVPTGGGVLFKTAYPTAENRFVFGKCRRTVT
jgi:hypothetical protein